MKKSQLLPLVAGLVGLASADSAIAEGTKNQSAPPEKDREAILAMAGEYEVIFNFEETVSLQPDYKLKDAYQEEALEKVVVVADEPGRIVLQHLLVVRGDRVVKHWKQVWTWQDTRIVEFLGNGKWRVRELDPAEVEGTWSQQVTQVDDSPRYESYAAWQHDGGYSRWESKPTNRPLPRREHTKRDDYQVLVCTNRHGITPHGWVHEQDSIKMVVDGDGAPVRYIAAEQGVNYYDRTEEVDLSPATTYWEKTKDYWADVSDFWYEVERERDAFAIEAGKEGEQLSEEMFDLAKAVVEGGDAPADEAIAEAIGRYLQ